MPPVLMQFQTHVPGNPNDNIAYVWVMHWVREVVTHGLDLFYDPSTYYPHGYPVTAIETTLANSLSLLPVTLAFGPVVAYNTAVLLSFALTSLGTFLWVSTFTPNRFVALIAGVLSAFVPYHLIYVAGGQLPQITTQWIPFTLFALERYLRAQSGRWMAFAGFFFGLNALASWYNLVFLALALPPYLLFRLGKPARLLRRTTFWVHVTIGVILVGAMIVPVAIPYARAQRDENRAYFADYLAGFSVNPLHFLAPSVQHPVWGDWAARELPLVERQARNSFRTVTAGYLVVLAALVGVALSKQRRLVNALSAMAAVSLIGASGPLLVDFGGTPVMVTLPPAVMTSLEQTGVMRLVEAWLGPNVVARMRSESSTVIPLPYALIYRTPVVSSLRAVSRYSVLMHFALIGLAALGADALLRRARARLTGYCPVARALPALALGLFGSAVLFEFWVKPMPTTELRARPVDRWLAEQPFGAVVEMPLGKAAQRLGIYAQIEHRQPLALGMWGSFPPPIDAERRAALERLPDPDAVREVCAWGVRYILISNYSWVNPTGVERLIKTVEAIPEARKAGVFDIVHAYVLEGCAQKLSAQ